MENGKKKNGVNKILKCVPIVLLIVIVLTFALLMNMKNRINSRENSTENETNIVNETESNL